MRVAATTNPGNKGGMAPRKSTSRSVRPSHSGQSGPGEASSSKPQLNSLPGPDVASSITSGYEADDVERDGLNEVEREMFIHDLVCFHPRDACDQFTEKAKEVPYVVSDAVEGWAKNKWPDGGDDLQRELDMGLVALDTLLESHIDKAMDKFTAWMLRNAFEIPSDLEVVLPWQRGLDFPRAKHVVDLPEGEQSLDMSLENLRLKVEQMRLLSQRLIIADQTLDRRLQIAKQRKEEVGFLKDVLASSGLSPLPQKTEQIMQALQTLHSSLTPLSDPAQTANPSAPPGEGTKAWQLGRQAYLNWAVGKFISQSGNAQPDVKGERTGNGGSARRASMPGAGEVEMMDEIQKEMMESGSAEGIDRMTRGLEGQS